MGPKTRLADILRETAALLVTQQRHEEAVGVLQEALDPQASGDLAR